MTSNQRGAVFSAVLIGILGAGEFWNQVWRIPEIISEATEDRKIQIVDSVDKVMESKITSLYENLPKIMAVSGLSTIDSTPEESIRHLMDLIEFGDKRMEEHQDFVENELPFIRNMMSRDADYQQCGYVLGKNGKPVFWVACDGQKRRIFFGKPNRKLINDVYYYTGDNGRPVVISSLSSVLIQ